MVAEILVNALNLGLASNRAYLASRYPEEKLHTGYINIIKAVAYGTHAIAMRKARLVMEGAYWEISNIRLRYGIVKSSMGNCGYTEDSMRQPMAIGTTCPTRIEIASWICDGNNGPGWCGPRIGIKGHLLCIYLLLCIQASVVKSLRY